MAWLHAVAVVCDGGSRSVQRPLRSARRCGANGNSAGCACGALDDRFLRHWRRRRAEHEGVVRDESAPDERPKGVEGFAGIASAEGSCNGAKKVAPLRRRPSRIACS